MHIICPFCQNSQIVQENQMHAGITRLHIFPNAEGDIGLQFEAIACANPECQRTILSAALATMPKHGYGEKPLKVLKYWPLIPQGSARPLPDFIPQAIRDDYTEACLIRDLSPKASATLIRRCLQGMIRDFCGIKKGTLNAEITALREAVDNGTAPRGVSEESVEAIDSIRTIGNIGAHMEKDIDLIIPVDPDEAQALIELTEMLFSEWYIERQKRAERLEKIKMVAEEKRELKSMKLLPASE